MSIIDTFGYDATFDPAMPVNEEVIVGRDVLNHLDVHLNGPASSVEIAADNA